MSTNSPNLPAPGTTKATSTDFPTASAPRAASLNVPAIAGSLSGLILIFAVIAVLLFCHRRRQQRRADSGDCVSTLNDAFKWGSQERSRTSTLQSNHLTAIPSLPTITLQTEDNVYSTDTKKAYHAAGRQDDTFVYGAQSPSLSTSSAQSSQWPSPTLEAASLRRQELQRRIDDVQSTIVSLSTPGSSGGVRIGRTVENSETASIRRTIAEFRVELEQLRSQQEQLRAFGVGNAPPSYVSRG